MRESVKMITIETILNSMLSRCEFYICLLKNAVNSRYKERGKESYFIGRTINAESTEININCKFLPIVVSCLRCFFFATKTLKFHSYAAFFSLDI